MANRLSVNERRVGPVLGLEVEGMNEAPAREGVAGASVACGFCHYENRVSYAFFVLSVQHMYCRRCGRMIDRAGKPVQAT